MTQRRATKRPSTRAATSRAVSETSRALSPPEREPRTSQSLRSKGFLPIDAPVPSEPRKRLSTKEKAAQRRIVRDARQETEAKMNTLYPALDAPVDAPWLMRALGYLGLPPELGQRVQGWTGDPRQMRAVIEFLHRAQWERKAWEDRLAAGRAVYGQAGDRHYDTGRKEKRGERDYLDAAVETVRHAIRRALYLHGESTGDIYDHRIALAWKPMEEVLAALDAGEVEISPDLPPRKRGKKPGMTFPRGGGAEPTRGRRRDLDAMLYKLLKPAVPREQQKDLKGFAKHLLDALFTAIHDEKPEFSKDIPS